MVLFVFETLETALFDVEPADFSAELSVALESTGMEESAPFDCSADALAETVFGAEFVLGLAVVVLMTMVVFGFSHFKETFPQVNKKLFKRIVFVRTCSFEVI